MKYEPPGVIAHSRTSSTLRHSPWLPLYGHIAVCKKHVILKRFSAFRPFNDLRGKRGGESR